MITACSTGFASCGVWLSLDRWPGGMAAGIALLALLGIYLFWLGAVLLRLFPFDAGGLLADPAALKTIYTFWLTLVMSLAAGVGLGLASAWLRARDGD